MVIKTAGEYLYLFARKIRDRDEFDNFRSVLVDSCSFEMFFIFLKESFGEEAKEETTLNCLICLFNF